MREARAAWTCTCLFVCLLARLFVCLPFRWFDRCLAAAPGTSRFISDPRGGCQSDAACVCVFVFVPPIRPPARPGADARVRLRIRVSTCLVKRADWACASVSVHRHVCARAVLASGPSHLRGACHLSVRRAFGNVSACVCARVRFGLSGSGLSGSGLSGRGLSVCARVRFGRRQTAQVDPKTVGSPALWGEPGVEGCHLELPHRTIWVPPQSDRSTHCAQRRFIGRGLRGSGLSGGGPSWSGLRGAGQVGTG
jgi:hypothetical protein